MSSLEQTLIEFWLILRFTAAQIQQQPRLLDSLGAPRFTLGEIETVIGQIRARNATPVEVGPAEHNLIVD